jgi:peptidoglycan/LPS O-acetylase OafA/YrhL
MSGQGDMSKGLTSFRALAFFAIFFAHTNGITSNQLGLAGGYVGVLAFFVLSGFLLTPILIDMQANLNKKDFFVHFYGRRALRIFPLYYSYLLVVTFVSFIAISMYGKAAAIPFYRFIEQLPWTISYTYDFYHASIYFKHTYFATHFWSLAVEEQFYLVWPLVIFIIPARHLKKFLLLVILAGPVIRSLLAAIIDAQSFPLLHRTDLVIYILPFSHFDAFAIGGYFALYGVSRSSYRVWLSILFVVALGMVTSWISTLQIQWDEFGYGPCMKDSYKYVWGYSAVNLMFAYILVHVRSNVFMPALFENKLLVYLGTISYGLYVFHFPMLWVVDSVMHNFPPILKVSTSLLLTVLISIASYEFMEKRFINLKDKYFARASANKLLNPTSYLPRK